MATAYAKDIQEGNVGLGEFICSRWLVKSTEIYGFFEERLKKINPEFDQITSLTDSQAEELLEASLKEFGAIKTYIFAVFNEVAFSDAKFEELKQKAYQEQELETIAKEEQESIINLESLQKKHAREISTITDRFEKKMNGLQKKYLNDVEVLKKQISLLQRKLSEINHESKSA